MKRLLWLSVFFSCYGMAQEDPLVGQWQRVGYYIHECGTDKVISTEGGTAGFIEEFRVDVLGRSLGHPGRGNGSNWRTIRIGLSLNPGLGVGPFQAWTP